MLAQYKKDEKIQRTRDAKESRTPVAVIGHSGGEGGPVL